MISGIVYDIEKCIYKKGIDIMNWVEMDIYTTTEGIEAVTGSLLGMGINGFVIKDAKDFQDFLDDKDGNWDYIDDDLMGLKNCETTVTVYLPENAQGLENLEAMKLELKALKKRDVNNEFGRLEYELKTSRKKIGRTIGSSISSHFALAKSFL